jgi:anti-anti-sigma regulatory factor
MLREWEAYETRSQAVQALRQKGGQHILEPWPPEALPLLQVEEADGVTCVQYDYETWTSQVEAVQPQLRALAGGFGPRRIVLDFSGQNLIGSPSIACIYLLVQTVQREGVSFSVCGVGTSLREFFHGHGERLTFPLVEPGESEAVKQYSLAEAHLQKASKAKSWWRLW